MAARGSTVTVLTPNGRQQTVKVSPNTYLLQVLEEVCNNHGFEPDDYGLKFQRALVDLTRPWRFANLPNNAKLEMVTSSRKQTEAQVRIALQMEDGSRLQDSFSSGQSLWELITHFPEIRASLPSESGSTPVCVYMRDEVSGEEALKRATLKSLGLTGGSAIVRFLLKRQKSASVQDDASEAAAIPATPVAKETTPIPPSQPEPTPSLPEASTSKVPTADVPMEASALPPVPVAAPSARPAQREDASNPQDAVRHEAPHVGGSPPTPVEDSEEAGPSGLNANPSSSSSSAAAAAPSAPFIPFSGGGHRLGRPDGPAGSAPSSHSAPRAVVESPKGKKAKFNPASNSKSQTDPSRQDEQTNPEEFLERESTLFHSDSRSCQSQDQIDIPDEFFEVTVDDVKKRYAQLKRERELLEDAPLMTRSLREAQIKKKLDRYPKVVLRIQFPDRHVLQGFFRPLETVEAVLQLVRSHLEDPQLNFYLFTAPPKTILSDPSATLFEAKLFPSALVYIGSDANADCCIKAELLQSVVSASQADQAVASFMMRSTTPSSSSASSSSLVNGDEPPFASELYPIGSAGNTRPAPRPFVQTQGPRTNRSDPEKLPKWLKLPGKK
ncbi:unnamed protein product [Ophioblennius macclurei]